MDYCFRIRMKPMLHSGLTHPEEFLLLADCIEDACRCARSMHRDYEIETVTNLGYVVATAPRPAAPQSVPEGWPS